MTTHISDRDDRFGMLQYCVKLLKSVYCITYYTTIIAPYPLPVKSVCCRKTTLESVKYTTGDPQ
jgi:hypothetical protein